jgi:hypothetical protein
MRETSPSHGILISSLIKEKTNRTKMVVVDDFMANRIPMFSLMEPKTILSKIKMVDKYQEKGQNIY